MIFFPMLLEYRDSKLLFTNLFAGLYKCEDLFLKILFQFEYQKSGLYLCISNEVPWLMCNNQDALLIDARHL